MWALRIVLTFPPLAAPLIACGVDTRFMIIVPVFWISSFGLLFCFDCMVVSYVTGILLALKTMSLGFGFICCVCK